MEIREQQNLIRLLIESFSLANKAGASIAATILVLIAVVGGGFWLLKLLPISLVKFPIFGALWGLFSALVCGLASIVIFRLLAAKAENNNESVSNAFANSILPFIYTFIYQIVIGILFVPLFFALNFIPILGPILFAVINIYIAVRLVFAPLAIAVRDAGPVSAITHSWQLTSGYWWYTFGALLLSALPSFLIVIILLTVRRIIPLYFAASFDLANLSMVWLIVLIVLAGVFAFLTITSLAFFVLVFLNLDYGVNRDSFIPMPQVEINEQPTQVFGKDNNVLPPGAGNTVTTQDVIPQVEVLQSSVKAETDHPEITQHLHQVYQPKPEDVVEYTEEDRMPTILFDDEMAKQLERQRTMWEEKMNSDKQERDDNDSSSIKMSK